MPPGARRHGPADRAALTPSALPDGEPVPPDGALPPTALDELHGEPLSVYLHVPFCRTRCGYCDFNTYTATELGGGAADAVGSDYLQAMLAEIELARRVLAGRPRGVGTVFVGGGTPTLLPAADLGRLVAAVDDAFGLLPDAEITTESNPESLDAAGLGELAGHGFNRISFGMQSAVPHVLAVLDRSHTPGRPEQAVAEARAAGFAHVSLDLIYGTPGESIADWRTSLTAALAAAPDHLSAYALIIEQGTRLERRIRRGELPAPDDDDLADKYLLADELLTAAGLHPYELSNWARYPADACRHNLTYWTGGAWWGFGPGAHSHVGGVRWWNVKHPASYARRLAEHTSPGHARELLSAADRRIERVLLEIRLATGLPIGVLTDTERDRLPDLLSRDLASLVDDRLSLTLAGRLVADAVVRDLLD